MSKTRPIPGFVGFYEVDESGVVHTVFRRDIRSDGRPYSVKSATRRSFIGKDGYVRVQLKLNGKVINRTIHNLVALAWIGPPPSENHEINHKNGLRSDNRWKNLEWVTRSENNQHAFSQLGRSKNNQGHRTLREKLSYKIVAINADSGEVVHKFDALKDAHKEGFKAPAICRCLDHPTKTHRGLKWVRANPPKLASFPA